MPPDTFPQSPLMETIFICSFRNREGKVVLIVLNFFIGKIIDLITPFLV